MLFACYRHFDQTMNEIAVLVLHRQLVIDLDAPPPGDDFLAVLRIDRRLVVVNPRPSIRATMNISGRAQ